MKPLDKQLKYTNIVNLFDHLCESGKYLKYWHLKIVIGKM